MTIDDLIVKIFAVIFLVLLTIIQIALLVILILCKIITYPFEFFTAMIMEAKDICRCALDSPDE